jgi:uncharacterized membrane protein
MAGRLMFLGVGAALMYLMDPQAGKKRRNDLKNQLDATKRKLQHGKEQVAKDAANRMQGLKVETSQFARSMTSPWTKTHWSPAQRALAGGLGAGFATIGYFRGGLKGTLMMLLGGTLFARAAANEELRKLVKGKGFQVEKTIQINAPVEQVYAYWRNLENFPQWMSHVREVRYVGGDRFHWIVDGPAGAPVEWDSQLLDVSENREMTWRSVEGSTVEHSGRVRFEPADEGTRVHVQMHYAPPGGVLGHAVAKAFGVDPKSEMDDDLLRLKSLVETGELPRDGAMQKRLGMNGSSASA